jgi:hypothetical protein
MELSDVHLDKVKRMAAAAFSIAEIADVLELPVKDIKVAMNDEESPLFKAYRSGYLTRQLELRERIFKDARNGSSPAQTIAHKLLEDVIIKNKL